MALITAKNLAVGYDSNIVAKIPDFAINSGDYLCIVGENGAGKSTLVKTLLGLLEPSDGEMTIGEGFDLNRIGYLPQQTDIQKDFPASVTEVVLSGCQGRKGMKPFYNKEDKEIAVKSMEQLGIYGLRKKCYRELSGGQQQRVLLARALSAASRMILLDEPVAGLDPAAASTMYTLIERFNSDGMTVIMITHDVNAAMKYATQILAIGEESFYGSRDDYLNMCKDNSQITAVHGTSSEDLSLNGSCELTNGRCE